jgi:hypothetical protein
MQKITFILLATVFYVNASAQDINRLSFDRLGLFYQNGNAGYQSVKSPLGHTIGLEGYVNPVYNGYDEDDAFNLGYSLNAYTGWNVTTKKLSSDGLDIGVWGAYLFSPDFELGLQYSFLGYYVFQNASQAGSSIHPALRFKKLQLTLGRSGKGIFYGCIVPRQSDQLTAQNSVELSYFISKKFVLGGRLTGYEFGGTKTNEFRIFIGRNFGEVMNTKRFFDRKSK